MFSICDMRAYDLMAVLIEMCETAGPTGDVHIGWTEADQVVFSARRGKYSSIAVLPHGLRASVVGEARFAVSKLVHLLKMIQGSGASMCDLRLIVEMTDMYFEVKYRRQQGDEQRPVVRAIPDSYRLCGDDTGPDDEADNYQLRDGKFYAIRNGIVATIPS